MNKKNKGFTVIELITSFTLASVIMIILFNIILILKDNLSEVNAKTNMLVEKDNLSYNINKRFKEKEISSITMCEDGDKCYEFTYSDNTSDKLIYSNTDKTITFNNYTFDIIDGITVEEPTITEHYDTMSSTKYNGYFIIHIPIKIDNKDYSIKVVKHFNTDSLVIDFPKYEYDSDGNKYTVIEYLESTGTQYIDSNIALNVDTTIESDFEFTQVASYYATPYGYVLNSNNNALGIYCYASPGSVYTAFGSAIDVAYNDDIVGKRKYYVHNKNGLWVNDVKKVSYNNIVVSTSSNPIIIFARRGSDNNIKRNAFMKLYLFKIYDNDKLVRDYIPVIDSNSRPCLFDKVSRECYYNQGSGEFLYG